MKTKTLAYICAPYRGKTDAEIDRNIKYACSMGRKAWRRGLIPVIPHINSTAIFGKHGKNSEVTDFDLQLLARCDVMIVPSTQAATAGMAREHKFCLEHQIPVHFLFQYE